MGDARHKRAPKKGDLRKVTPLFVKQVKAGLLANEVHNAKHHLKKGDPGYRPQSPQDLADHLGCDPNAMKDLLGGVRPGTKVKPPGRSRFVDPLSELFGIESVITIDIPSSAADLIGRILAMTPEERADLDAKARKKP